MIYWQGGQTAGDKFNSIRIKRTFAVLTQLYHMVVVSG